MKSTVARLAILAFFFAVAAPLYAQMPDPREAEIKALQQQLDLLQTQVSALQNQIKQLNSADPPAANAALPSATATTAEQQSKPEAAAELKTGQPVQKATAEYETDSQDQIAAARLDNSPLDPKYPNYFRLPGTRTFLRIGGYAKTDLTFDPRPAGDAERFIPATIPINPAANVSNAMVGMRPSRINADFLVPMENRTLRFFVEMDFFGSNSTTPRLRHAYAQGRNILVGQTFSNFMDPDTSPDSLDFQGPNSQISIRTPQFRYTWKVGSSNSLSMSVEKPTSDVAFKTPEFSAVPSSPAPDGTVQFRHEMKSGHVQFSALMRDISLYLPDGRDDSVFGWGFNVTGLQKVGKDNLVYQGAYGRGIERYMNDTSGLGIDAQINDTINKQLVAVPVAGAYGGYQHYWTSKLRSSAIFGYAQVQNTASQSGSAFHDSGYSAGNLIWNPLGPLHFGVEVLYGWRENKDGSSGNAPRVQLSAKYNFMQMKSSPK